MKKIYKFSIETELDKKEITTESIYAETLGMEELLGMFRQYLLLLSYTEDQVKNILPLSEDDLEILKIGKEDLQIYNWDNIL